MYTLYVRYTHTHIYIYTGMYLSEESLDLGREGGTS